MEEDLNLLEMEDDSNFFLQAKASLAPELGTAQPQLVSLFFSF